MHLITALALMSVVCAIIILIKEGTQEGLMRGLSIAALVIAAVLALLPYVNLGEVERPTEKFGGLGGTVVAVIILVRSKIPGASVPLLIGLAVVTALAFGILRY